MSFDDTGILPEVQDILSRGPQPVLSRWQCQLFVGGAVITPLKLLSIDVERLYHRRYSDVINLQIVLGAGMYSQKVWPYRQNLVVHLINQPVAEEGQEVIAEVPTVNMQLRGVLSDDSSSLLENNSAIAADMTAEDLTDLRVVNIQLIDFALEQVRLKTVGGIYRGNTPADVLTQLLTEQSQDPTVPQAFQVRGVDRVTPDNQNKRDHITIPPMRLVDLPQYLQEKAGGIYSSGLGFYLQDGIWYLYPEFNTERFSRAPRKLTIFSLPPDRFPGIERTYRLDGKNLTILSTGLRRHEDGSERLQLNQGNGVRFTDASKVMENFGSTSGNKTTIKRRDNNHEYVAFQRETGLNWVPVDGEGVSANPFVQASRLAQRKGSTLQLTWENSAWGFLFPGMPVKFIYYRGNDIHETEGVLLGAHHYIQNTERGMIPGRHVCTSALTLFLRNDFEWEDIEVGV